MPRNGESEDRTQFCPEDAPREQQDHYEMLRNTNRGYWKGFAVTANQRATERHQRFQTIASQLELTDYQEQEGQRMLDSIDLQRLGLSLDLVLFSLCALVVRDDGRAYHPYRSNDNNDDLFVELAEDLEFRQSQIASCWEKLRRQFKS